MICDRFVDSSRAYQGAAGGLGDEAVRALHAVGSGGVLPDRTILLELDAGAAAARLAARDGDAADKIGGRGEAFHDAVAAAFARFAAEEPARFVRIDAAGGAEAVHRRVIAALAPLLDEPRR